MESWKKYQKKAKFGTWIQRLIGFGVFVLLALVGVGIYNAFLWVRSPVEGASQQIASWDKPKWDGDFQINLFIFPEYVVGFDSQEKHLQFITIDDSPQKEELPLYMRKKQLYLDGYILFENNVDEVRDINSQIRQELMRGSVTSNLSRWQLLELWWDLRKGYRITDNTDIELPETEIVEENLRVSVLNGTTVAGLATEVSEWLQNSGVIVVNVGNFEREIDQSKIRAYIPADKEYRTLFRVKQILNTDVTHDPEQEQNRYDVEVIVGKDFLQ